MAKCNFRTPSSIKLKLLRPYPCKGCVHKGREEVLWAPLESSMPCKTLVCDVALVFYKLFSSIRVWSSTWCMPRFSSLAWASFSGGGGEHKRIKCENKALITVPKAKKKVWDFPVPVQNSSTTQLELYTLTNSSNEGMLYYYYRYCSY